MCELIEHKNLMTGYGCCRCRTYNGLHRDSCKYCGVLHCPLEAEGETLEPGVEPERSL